jgi:hypothetical protein
MTSTAVPGVAFALPRVPTRSHCKPLRSSSLAGERRRVHACQSAIRRSGGNGRAATYPTAAVLPISPGRPDGDRSQARNRCAGPR